MRNELLVGFSIDQLLEGPESCVDLHFHVPYLYRDFYRPPEFERDINVKSSR